MHRDNPFKLRELNDRSPVGFSVVGPRTLFDSVIVLFIVPDLFDASRVA